MRRWIDELSFRTRVILTILVGAIAIAVIVWDVIEKPFWLVEASFLWRPESAIRSVCTLLVMDDWAAYWSPFLFVSGSSDISRDRMRGSEIGGGFLLPSPRQNSPTGFAFGAGSGSGLRFISSTPSRSTFLAGRGVRLKS
jgi:hypothetical protein